MRVLKLLAMGLAGYALYELGRSIYGSMGTGAAGASPAARADQRRSVLSGAAQEGMSVDVADDSGTAHSQVVGRGVVRR